MDLKLYVTAFDTKFKVTQTNCWIISKTHIFRDNALRRNPLFSIGSWNTFNRTDEELPRANDNIVGWHESIQGNLSSCHPNFWKIFGNVKKEVTFVCSSRWSS